jgi:glucose/arabinose dehydrogenase
MQQTTFLGKMTTICALILHFSAFLNAQSQPKIQLKQFASGFVKPVDIAHCGDKRLFIVEQDGTIQILDSVGGRQSVPFLDINSRVNSNGNEQGLLGLAFHPNFNQNGWFFVNYTQNNGDTRVSRFTAPDPAAIPLTADPNSEKILLEIDQPYSNHNGGCIKFGADNYLYISLGDGGSGGDPQNNSQKKGTRLGKMLRIDVNVPDAPYYAVPADNPFVGQSDYLPEIWSLGLRNVWRFSFDRLTGDMWMGDVGQNEWEEVDFEPAGEGGHNYGWRCYEGNATYNTSGCGPASNYTAPVFVYGHSGANSGCSITGGFVYRGSKFPLLYGKYIVADYCSGRFWYLTPNGDGTFTSNVLATLSAYEYSSFGENSSGELYLTTLSTGRVMRLDELCSSLQVTNTVQPTCPHDNTGSISLTVSGGVAPYTYAWTGGISTASVSNIGPGTYTVVVKDNNQCQVVDTIVVPQGDALAPLTISFLSGDSLMCTNESLMLGASGVPANAAGLQWFRNGFLLNGATGATYTVGASEEGIYYARWQDGTTGCWSPFVPVTVTFDPIPANSIVRQDNVLQLSDLAAVATGYTFQWLLDNTPITGATSPTLNVSVEGAYALVVTSAAGCSETYTFAVGTYDIPALKQFVVTPNPGNGLYRVEITLDQSLDVQLSVLDLNGKPVLSRALSGKNLITTADIRHLPAGTYTIVLQSGTGRVARQLVKT